MTRPVPSTLSVRVPFAVRKRGGRKLVITPDGTTGRLRSRIDSALVKPLARAHRWQRLLESGECASITELAAAEKIDRSYLCRVLRLTLLAPEIVEAILDGAAAGGGNPAGVDDAVSDGLGERNAACVSLLNG